MLSLLLDLLFPRYSLTGEEGTWMTEEERIKLQRQFPVRLHRPLLRKRGITHLDCLIAAGSYDSSPLLKKAILTFKYGRITHLQRDLGDLMVQATPGLLLPPRSKRRAANPQPSPRPTVCPVPLHWLRQYARGFNQAELLAQHIGHRRGWKVEDLLKRTRPTGHQAHRKRERRLRALTGAFRYAGPPVPPHYALLIDDLATTGATLDECAAVLKKAGVKRVDGLVVALG